MTARRLGLGSALLVASLVAWAIVVDQTAGWTSVRADGDTAVPRGLPRAWTAYGLAAYGLAREAVSLGL